MSERKRHSAEQKVMILRELLENNVPSSQLAEKFNLHVNDIYNWKNEREIRNKRKQINASQKKQN
ncbi:MAG: transposase [Ignavibacteria bacterium]|nr:transposase [Ignavibacteria bacterium]MBK7158116.1 transposase [Ignavibacteria bacterium]MBK9404174.1 transposase [Ignavibacteria bacterium]